MFVIREAEGSGLKKFEVPGTGWYPSRWISAKRSEAKEEAHNSGRRDIRTLGFQRADVKGYMYRREGS